jgi:bifunctional UDP-N-acetylglucosamine pyrophosphorylase/glucosamine-1-phosphate N-acetyltransferase
MSLSIVILAAGLGTRMRSQLPKVLHPLGGKPMLQRALEASYALNPDAVYVVYSKHSEAARQRFTQFDIHWVEQKEQLGTAHALNQALPAINPEHRVLVLCGDVPLVSSYTLNNLLKKTDDKDIGMITAITDDPAGLGRIVRNQKGDVLNIVEEKDASAQELQINEIFSGILTASASKLGEWLPKIKNENKQQEYYLPDVVPMAVADSMPIKTVQAVSFEEVQGVNDRVQLARLERFYQYQGALQLLEQGVMLMDPRRFDLRGELDVEMDVTIDVNVVLSGHVSIGSNSSIGANCSIHNAKIGSNVTILANTVVEDAQVGDNCTVGPFARLRPGTQLEQGARVGNFVEIKNSIIGVGTKANHLTYLGDACIGNNVNVGAGTITCNYDGANKHQTTIGDGAFIGSNTQLVAPITVGNNATIGAGSTITRNAPADQLTVARVKQKTFSDWQRPSKDSVVEDVTSK